METTIMGYIGIMYHRFIGWASRPNFVPPSQTSRRARAQLLGKPDGRPSVSIFIFRKGADHATKFRTMKAQERHEMLQEGKLSSRCLEMENMACIGGSSPCLSGFRASGESRLVRG